MNRRANRGSCLLVATAFVGLVVAGCSGSSPEHGIVLGSVPPSTAAPASAPAAAASTAPTPGTGAVAPAPATVTIDVTKPGAAISPDILGVSSTLTADQMHQAGITLNSWGGNPATRYNYNIGHAWNQAADYEFRNTNYSDPAGDSAQTYVQTNKAAAVKTRMAIPTLGWVAKDDNPDTCSFPDGKGGCRPASAVGDCKSPKMTADPKTANVASTPDTVKAWLTRMAAAGAVPDIVTMDNEPDLWGNTHYDVHPTCPTFQEILDKYLTYAQVVRGAMPSAALAGPALCCWYDYWHIAPAAPDGSNEDFLSWFLDGVKAHDDSTGTKSIDYLDVHYYPQSDVYNDKDDPQTDARRLRSTRSLWDPNYTDESWMKTNIAFIPRMRKTIADHYPGLKLLISEWNFGDDSKINGALAIADTLGIYGREGVDAAAYWRNPPVGSPGWFAFTMHGNYDGKGSRFGGTSVPAQASDPNDVGAYAAVDPASGVLRVMLINRDPSKAQAVTLGLDGFHASANAQSYVYSGADPTQIVHSTVATSAAVAMPASSITVLEIPPG